MEEIIVIRRIPALSTLSDDVESSLNDATFNSESVNLGSRFSEDSNSSSGGAFLARHGNGR